MTNKELFTQIFGIDKCDCGLGGCVGLRCIEPNQPCNRCPYNSFWSKQVDLGKIYANISVMGLGKALLNSMYGKTVSYKDTDSFPMNPPIEDEWIKVPYKILNSNLTYNIAEILDDATVHGLDFKYENGEYYYKERQDVPN